MPEVRLKRSVVFAAVALALAMVTAGPVFAQPTGTRLRVVDTADNDVLNVREYPTASSRIVGVIPPDATDVIYQGERRSGWAFVSYRRVEGWVSERFVRPYREPVRRGRNLDDDENQ